MSTFPFSPPSPAWPPGQVDPPFLPIHRQPLSTSFPCLLLLALSQVSGKGLTPGILRMLSHLPSSSRITAQRRDPAAEQAPVLDQASAAWMPGCQFGPLCTFLRLAPEALHLQASHWSLAQALNPRFSASPAGWSGWREHWELPILPAPLHGAVAERGQVQRHHSGHDQVSSSTAQHARGMG